MRLVRRPHVVMTTASHRGRGWEEFTSAVIKMLNTERQDVVFVLWGEPAQKKGSVIDGTKHCIITSPHPSPLSAFRGMLCIIFYNI